jgi:hypothetical protein
MVAAVAAALSPVGATKSLGTLVVDVTAAAVWAVFIDVGSTDVTLPKGATATEGTSMAPDGIAASARPLSAFAAATCAFAAAAAVAALISTAGASLAASEVAAVTAVGVASVVWEPSRTPPQPASQRHVDAINTERPIDWRGKVGLGERVIVLGVNSRDDQIDASTRHAR